MQGLGEHYESRNMAKREQECNMVPKQESNVKVKATQESRKRKMSSRACGEENGKFLRKGGVDEWMRRMYAKPKAQEVE